MSIDYLEADEAESLLFWGFDDDEGVLQNASCPKCGDMMVEEPDRGGAMFRCLPRAANGPQPTPEEASPRHFFYVSLPYGALRALTNA